MVHNQEADSDLADYVRCMSQGYPEACYRIECKHSLDALYARLCSGWLEGHFRGAQMRRVICNMVTVLVLASILAGILAFLPDAVFSTASLF